MSNYVCLIIYLRCLLKSRCKRTNNNSKSLISVTALAQSKLHIDLDYQYSMGMSEKFAGNTYSRGSYKFGGNLLQVAARYDVAIQWSVGIGMGLARYTEPDFNTYPVFATGISVY